jgi:predicted PurR-regulated permease PerM
MLYLLFFFVRDGDAISKRITDAIPLPAEQQSALVGKSTIVIRAMFKGNLLVAAAQGALGGLIFWILGIHAPVLWAVVMALLSLLPAVGAAAVWLRSPSICWQRVTSGGALSSWRTGHS